MEGIGRLRYLVLTLVGGLVVAGAPAAHAATFAPTRFDDPPPGACTAASCSLREAVIAANANPGDDTIVLAQGTYQLTIGGAGEDASLTGDLDVLDSGEIAGSLEIVGAAGAKSVIDAGNLDRVVDVFSRLTLRQVTLRHGTADVGGLIRNGSNLLLLTAIFEQGTATGAGGGGVYNAAQLTTLTTIWDRNEATGAGGRGGAIFSTADASTTLTTTVLSSNRARDAGGAIFNLGAFTVATASVTRAATLSSGGSGGGAIFNGGLFTIVNANVDQSTSASSGGAIMNTGRLAGARLGIRRNRADDLGGGVANTGMITLHRSTLNGNDANRGGGLGTTGSLGRAELFNVTISGNAAQTGGGVFAGGPVRLAYNTLALNQAARRSQGGGIFAAGPPGSVLVDATDTIVAYSNGGDCAGAGIASSGYNLSSDPTCPFTAPGDQRNVNPWLAPLGDYGGGNILLTHALLWGSPAIDRGTCLTPPFALEDERGVPRPQDGNGDGNPVCDIGAFELRPGEFIRADCTSKENRKELHEHQKDERKSLQDRQKAEEKQAHPRQKAAIRLRHAQERTELGRHQEAENEACSPGPPPRAPGPPSEPPS